MNILLVFALFCFSIISAANSDDSTASCCFSFTHRKIVPINENGDEKAEISSTIIPPPQLIRIPSIRRSKKIHSMTGTLFRPIRAIDSLRILIIDADFNANLQLQRICNTIGISKIQSTNSVEEAMQQFFATEDNNGPFDVLFTDTDTTDEKTTTTIKKMNRKNDAIVISTSAIVSTLDTPNFKTIGIDDIFPRPFISDQLMAVLKRHIELYRKTSSNSIAFA